MAELHCIVVTPETTILEQTVEFVALPLFDGELGVQPGHAPLIGRLGYGEMRLKLGGTTTSFFVDGGFVQVANDIVSVLTSRAIPLDKIDSKAAAEQLAEALKRPRIRPTRWPPATGFRPKLARNCASRGRSARGPMCPRRNVPSA